MTAHNLSADEHHARAMLLGRIYIDWANMYVDKEDWERVTLNGNPIEWLDADTMEPVDVAAKMDRLLGATRKSLPEVAPTIESDPDYELAMIEVFHGKYLYGGPI